MTRKPKDNAARELAAADLDTTFFVEAAAGTGKTTSLVARILTAVSKGRARLSEIVAITFTEKAAGELKERLREELEKNLKGQKLREALADLERAHITTIHSLCAWILHERPVEAVVDPQFVVADELQRQLIFEEAWEEWLEAELASNPAVLRQALVLGVELDALPKLAALLVTRRDRLATVQVAAPIRLDVDRMLDELTSAAPALESCLKHFTAHDEKAYKSARILLDSLPVLANASTERKVAMLRSLELKQPKAKAHFDSAEQFSEMREVVKTLKPRLEEFAGAADHNFLIDLLAWLRGFVGHFQKAKHDRALLDFDDLLIKTRDLLCRNPHVRRELQKRFKFVLVDEFQDTDPVQSEIVLSLGEGTPGKLFLVGDPKQSIYSFRRADIEMFAATRRQIEQTGQVLTFQQNFRSVPGILDWVNDVFAKILVKSTDGDYQPDYIELQSWRTAAPAGPAVALLKPKGSIAGTADELRRAEATAVGRYLHALVGGGKYCWRDVALLFRSFTGVEIYADVLQELGVPYRVVGGKGYYQRQEIQTLSSLLCCLDNPADKLNLVAALRSPLFGWSDEEIFLASESAGLNYLRDSSTEAFRLLAELHACRHDFSVAGYVERVFTQTRICEIFCASQADGAQCVANLLKVLELARHLESAGVRSLRGFVRRLRETVLDGLEEETSPASEMTEDRVQILTVHKAKGLEFPVVVLPDLGGRSSDSGPQLIFGGKGNCELRFAKRKTGGFAALGEELDKREEAEEIRLLYVAATRARDRLVIPWFAEKGGRIDLLARGFAPGASELVEMPDWEALSAGVSVLPSTATVTTAKRMAERRAWLKRREELLMRSAKPLVRIRPSKLAGETELHEEEPGGVERERAMDFGSTVHEALERMNVEVIAGSKLNDADKHQAVVMVERAMKSQLFLRASKANELYRELPFSVVVEGALTEGKIDLLFCENGKWVLVDFKTDARTETERYNQQVTAYAAALARVAGIRVDEKLLYFVATDTLKVVNP